MDLLQAVLDYYDNTTEEKIKKDWEEIEAQHHSGISATEYEKILLSLDEVEVFDESIPYLFDTGESIEITSQYDTGYDNSCSIAEAA